MASLIRLLALRKFVLTLAIGAVGGWIMWHFNMPLAWLLGSMVACGVAAVSKLPLALPSFARPPMKAMIGAMLGTTFSPSVFDNIERWIVSMNGLIVFTTTAGSFAYIYFRRVAHFDHPTAFFSAMPGGLIEMVTLGSEEGATRR